MATARIIRALLDGSIRFYNTAKANNGLLDTLDDMVERVRLIQDTSRSRTV